MFAADFVWSDRHPLHNNTPGGRIRLVVRLPYPKVQDGLCASPVTGFQFINNRAAAAAFAVAVRRKNQDCYFMFRIEGDLA
jgi:hypothetical protein